MLHLKITPGGDTPLFRQIIDQVRTAVAAGKVDVGDPLPSVRALATELVVNPNTIAKAYTELVRDGLVESHRGRGYFIAPRRDIFTKKERQRRILALIQPLVAEAKTLGFDDDELIALIQDQLRRLSPSSSSSGGSS